MPRPSAITTAKPCSANHCEVRYAPRARSTRWACGPPYGSSSTGSRPCPGWCQEGNSTAVRISRGPAPNRAGRGAGSAGRSAREARVGRQLVLAVHPDGHAVVVEPAAPRRPWSRPRGRPSRRQPPSLTWRSPSGAVGPQPDLGRLGGRLEQDGVAVDAEDAADLQARRGDRDGIGPGAAISSRRRVSSSSPVQTIRPSAVQAGTPGTISSQRGSVSSRSTLGPAGAGVDRKQPHRPLVPALHHHQRIVLALPAGRDQVRERGAVGVDRHAGAVQPDQEEGHVGVRGARGGIGHLGGRPFRVGGIGDMPPGDRRLVHPRDQQRRTVGGPPVAALPVHLLRRDELGQPERHPRGALRIREHLGPAPSPESSVTRSAPAQT